MNGCKSPELDGHQVTSLDYFKRLVTATPMSFRDYMQAVLYDPQYGYYTAHQAKFGPEGDFITSALLNSNLFARCLVENYAHLSQSLDSASILEIGAGTGQLAKDCLDEIVKQGLPLAHYYIHEISPSLRARQAKTLCEHLDRVTWLEQLLPNSFEGMIIANELVDALPVHRFRNHNNVIEEEYVIVEKDQLSSRFLPPSQALNAVLGALDALNLAPDYHSEINIEMGPWLRSINACIKRGIILIIDYGFPSHEYYHADRSGGTLMCHRQHQSHTDPYIYPGLQDISSHVDFTRLALLGHALGLFLIGYCPQAYFLLGSNMAEKIDSLEDRRAAHILSSPAEMGELFKVIGFSKALEIALPGFGYLDRRHTLMLSLTG